MNTKFVVIATLIIIFGVLVSLGLAIWKHNIWVALGGLLGGTFLVLGLIALDKNEYKKKKE